MFQVDAIYFIQLRFPPHHSLASRWCLLCINKTRTRNFLPRSQSLSLPFRLSLAFRYFLIMLSYHFTCLVCHIPVFVLVVLWINYIYFDFHSQFNSIYSSSKFPLHEVSWKISSLSHRFTSELIFMCKKIVRFIACSTKISAIESQFFPPSRQPACSFSARFCSCCRSTVVRLVRWWPSNMYHFWNWLYLDGHIIKCNLNAHCT